MNIKPRYIVDEQNRKIAVQLDIATFEKIEDALENYVLHRYMQDDDKDESLNLEQAKSFYSELEKADAS